MLSVPQLDDLGYDRIFDRARTQIPLLTEEWTDFNHHDPGITMLQAFAWLTDTLNYYMNATGETHRLKYLKLLGLTPERVAASCDLSVDTAGPINLPRGTRLAAGAVPYELAESLRGKGNRLSRIYSEIDGSFYDLMPFAGVDDGYARIFTYDKEASAALYLGFALPLEEGVRIWVDVIDEPRNGFFDDFTLSELAWEYYADGRWRKVETIEDGSCGFLRDGYITLSFPGSTTQLENPVLAAGHYIRCRVVENGYDVLPQIGKIAVNSVRAVQTHTFAHTIELAYEGEDSIPLDYYIREEDVLTVAVRDGEEYMIWYEHNPDEDSLCEIAPGAAPWERTLVFSRERFGRVPEPGTEILVFVVDRSLWQSMQLGSTVGYAGERLEVDTENLYSMRLALSHKRGGRTYLELWEQCDDLTMMSCDARAFEYDSANREIVFGDSLVGMQPDSGMAVTVIELKTSLLEQGNVQKNQITTLRDPVDEDIAISNPAPVTNGKRPLDSQQLEDLIEAKLNKVSRAVNTGDYMALVRETPGLCIDLCTVVTMADYSAIYGEEYKPNTVLIPVKPYSQWERRPGLTPAYRDRIRENLERYRMLTVNVQVLPARYVGIGVYGRIRLRDNTPENRQSVLDCLSALIDFEKTGRFGENVVYGSVFSRLEMLECVAKVSQLSFDHYGDGGEKNAHGDIVVHPDALAFIQETNLEFI